MIYVDAQSSFESPKLYFGYYLKNSIITLLRYIILAQSNPIYVFLVSMGHHCNCEKCFHLEDFIFHGDRVVETEMVVTGQGQANLKATSGI